MEISTGAANALEALFDLKHHVLRLLVVGGGVNGIHVRLFSSTEALDGDVSGHATGVNWVVDPVSWQYLSNAEIDTGDSPNELHLVGVPEIGPGPGEGRRIVLEITESVGR